MAKNPGGNDRHVGSVDESDGKRRFAPAGKVHRYESGANTAGMNQRSPSTPPQPGGTSRSDGPRRPGSGNEGRG